MRGIICVFIFALTSTLSFAQDCAGWNDNGDSMKLRRSYEEYRKYLAQENYDDVIYFWSYIYRNAPAATKNVYLDGVKIYTYLYENEENPVKKEEHLNKIIEIFDQRANCFQGDLPNIVARKATQLKNLNVDLEIVYNAFASALDKAGNSIPSFALEPCAEITTQYFLEGGISEKEKDDVFKKIETVTSTNIANQNNTHNYEVAWKRVKKVFNEANIVPDYYGRLAKLEKDCYTITRSYKAKVGQDPENEALIAKAINELNNLDCEEASKYVIYLLTVQEKILLDKLGGTDFVAKSGSALEKANFSYNQGEYHEAIELYNEVVAETNDVEEKIKYTMLIAKIYYTKLDLKQESKQALLKVLQYDENNGQAYFLLGDLYYAAKEECFRTDSFAQKMAIVAAIEKWKKAKSLDASLAGVANERIQKYQPYTPSESEYFMQRTQLKGKYYYLGCWMNEKIRVKK